MTQGQGQDILLIFGKFVCLLRARCDTMRGLEL